MHRMLWYILLTILPLPTMSIDIGSMTAIMEPTKDFMARTITNNSSSPKIYELDVERLSDPTIKGVKISMEPGELLFTPKRFTLHSRKVQNVKFYYKGQSDSKERYYRVTFTESPAAQVDNGEQVLRRGTVAMKLALQSILVVRPRQVRFEYQLNPGGASITNTGNTFFEFMVKQGCEQPDSEADSKYLLPGETYQNPKIGKAGNQHIIIYQQRFIPLGKECWTEKTHH